LDGILNIVKPAGMTSFSVAAYIRGILKEKKIGHTGTLDPGACGLMTLCLGKATRAAEYIVSMEKTYIAELVLGKTTDTLDEQGRIIESKLYIYDKDKLSGVLKTFLGRSMQTPPMYSAIKVNGKKLYELARQGKDIERENREIFIEDIVMIDDKDPARILLKVCCSKGTYIRSLMADIGTRYGCGAHMGFLLRTGNGSFKINDAYTLEEVAEAFENGTPDSLLIDIERIFENYDKIILNEKETLIFSNGAFIDKDDLKVSVISGNIYAIYNSKNKFIGLGEIIVKGIKAYLKAKKLL
jgi:tRNA pseudouridine55 synthase